MQLRLFLFLARRTAWLNGFIVGILRRLPRWMVFLIVPIIALFGSLTLFFDRVSRDPLASAMSFSRGSRFSSPPPEPYTSCMADRYQTTRVFHNNQSYLIRIYEGPDMIEASLLSESGETIFSQSSRNNVFSSLRTELLPLVRAYLVQFIIPTPSQKAAKAENEFFSQIGTDN